MELAHTFGRDTPAHFLEYFFWYEIHLQTFVSVQWSRIHYNFPLLIGHDCEEKAAKFLGIFIDEYLTWQYHVSHVNSKVTRSLFEIKQVKHFLPKNSMTTLYHLLIHSHFSYITDCLFGEIRANRPCIVPKYFKNVQCVLLVTQNITVMRTHYLNLVEFKRKTCTYNSLFLSSNRSVSFTDMFKFNRAMPDARLARQSDFLHIDRCKSKFASSLPLYSLPIVWNRWVFLVSNPMSRIQFKTKIKLACINTYLSHVKCNYRRCPDCYPSTTN